MFLLVVLCFLSVGIFGQEHQDKIDRLWFSINVNGDHIIEKNELHDFFRFQFGEEAAISIKESDFVLKWTSTLGDSEEVAKYIFAYLDFNIDHVITGTDIDKFFETLDYDRDNVVTKMDEWDVELNRIYDGAPAV